MIHVKKILKEHMTKRFLGQKNWELREESPDLFHEGQVLLLLEIEGEDKYPQRYTGRIEVCLITSVLRNTLGLKEHYAILSTFHLSQMNLADNEKLNNEQ